MRVDRNLLGWGVFFIVVGAVPLAVRAGLIEPDAIDRWWSYWPLILIGVGLGLVLTRTPLEFLGGLIVSATFGLMVGSALTSGVGGFAGIGGIGGIGGVCTNDEAGNPLPPRSGAFSSPRAEVHLEMDCGDMTISTTGGSGGWVVQATDGSADGPSIEATDASLEVRSDRGSSFLDGGRESIVVELPSRTTIDLAIEMNAGTLRTDFAAGSLALLDVELNAGDATLDLADAAAVEGIDLSLNAGNVLLWLPSLSMTGSIEANAGNVDICAPDDVALRLHTGDSVLSSQDYGSRGLVQDGSTWETPGYDTAPVRIELRTEANVGSFSLDGPECNRG